MRSRASIWLDNLFTPPVWAVRLYRIAHWLWARDHPVMALAVTLPSRICAGVDIHPQATIGHRFQLSHGFGVVIGETAIIGDDCTVLHGVTLGMRDIPPGFHVGTRQHPRLGNRVRVGCNATLLGPITVGDDAIIGAGAVVLCDVPPGCTAVGVPARIRPHEARRV